jgi:hypothetical protein
VLLLKPQILDNQIDQRRDTRSWQENRGKKVHSPENDNTHVNLVNISQGNSIGNSVVIITIFLKKNIVDEDSGNRFTEALAIANEEAVVDEYLGRYPVIHLKLGTVTDFENIDGLINYLWSAVRSAYAEHEASIYSSEQRYSSDRVKANRSKRMIRQFETIMSTGDPFSKFHSLSESQRTGLLAESILELTNSLELRFEKKVKILQ